MKIWIGKFINFFIKKEPRTLIFIPHGGCFKDGYSIVNYTSDNALSLLRYMIEHYGATYKYCIAVGYEELEQVENEAKYNFPNVDICLFPLFFPNSINQWKMKKQILLNYWRVFFRGTFFFTSEAISFPYKLKCQTVTYLGYYIPFKNDFIPNVEFSSDKGISMSYDNCITTSLLSSQIISHTYDISLQKFHALGFSRNDELLNFKQVEELELFLKDSVDYPIQKVFLYTPTHRDYEQSTHNSIRDILGFHIEKEELSSILRKYSAVIVCKIHSKQNIDVLKKELPVGVLLHKPNSKYGLCELMKRSDFLITDYTSAYFDYLLLDRPVIFNFYDYGRYEANRGFSFDPLDSIIAGEIFTNAQSFLAVLHLALSGSDDYAQKRSFVRNLLHKFVDDNSSERICEFVLKEKVDDKEAFNR